MAEETQISNVGGDGVASEVTLQRLVTAQEAMAKKLGINNKGQALKLQELYNKSVKDGVEATKEQSEALKEQTESTQQATKANNRFAALMGNAVATGLGALARSSLELGKSLWQNETGIKAFTDLLPGIGGILAPFASYADETIESFRGLSNVGASFGGSLTEMRTASAGMGLSLGEMSDLFRANSQNLAALGGSVAQGAVRFQKMNKNLKATGDFRSLMNMGFSVEQINEGMGSYIELQRRMGTLQGKSTQELADGSADYLMQIDKLAKITGKTREEAEAALAGQATDSVARTLLNALKDQPEAYKNLQTSLALLDEVGGSTAEALKGMLTGNPTEAAGQLLAVLGDAGPGIADAMAKIGKGADPQVLLDAFKTAGGALEEFAGADASSRARIIQELKAQGNPLGDFLDNAVKMTDLGGRNLAATAIQQDAQLAAKAAETAALLTFEENQRELSAKMHEIFIGSGMLDLIGTAMTGAGNLLSGIATFLETIDFTDPLAAIGQILSAGMTAIMDNKGVVAALVAGIGLMFAGKAVVGAMKAGIGGAIGKLLPGGGAAAGGAKAGGGAGKGIAKIGSGLGKGLGLILKGIASGLIAFANPLVVAGAAAVGIAIGLIGAGIAGATWLVGNSMSSMSEGLKGFEDLNGEALKAAGAGMSAVAGGMAKMGGAGVVGAVGGAASGLISSISGFFGAENPLEKIKRFGEYEFNTAGITANAGAISAYAEAMNNMPVIDVERTGGVFGAIAGWFGGDEVMPWDSVKAFGDADISAAGVTANANAINAMSTSLNTFSAEKLDSQGILSYTSAMEKLVEVLGELNDALSADNKAGFGTGTNAGDVVSKMDTIGSGGGGSSDQLNSTMELIKQLLQEMRDLDIKVESNTRNIRSSNLAQGGVSN